MRRRTSSASAKRCVCPSNSSSAICRPWQPPIARRRSILCVKPSADADSTNGGAVAAILFICSRFRSPIPRPPLRRQLLSTDIRNLMTMSDDRGWGKSRSGRRIGAVRYQCDVLSSIALWRHVSIAHLLQSSRSSNHERHSTRLPLTSRSSSACCGAMVDHSAAALVDYDALRTEWAAFFGLLYNVRQEPAPPPPRSTPRNPCLPMCCAGSRHQAASQPA